MERIFQKQLAGTPGGSLMSGHRILALTPTKPGHNVHTTINPTIERSALAAIAGRYAGMTVDGPAQRPPAGRGGRGLLGPAAARLDDEDHHRDGGARGGDREAQHRVPLCRRGGDRRLHAAQRRRRGLRRDVPQRVRGLLQLGVRSARGPSSERSGSSTSPSGSGSTSHRRSRAPRRARSPRRATSAARWRSGRRRSGRARCSPARSR